LVLVVFAAFAFAVDEVTFRQEWTAFKAKFGRSYESSEETRRYSIFKSNYLSAIEQTKRAKYATFGVTKFSDLSTEEFKSLYLMPNIEANVSKSASKPKLASLKDLPDQFDWSSSGAITPVKDQEQCGSCWCFSATETLESVCFLAGYGLNLLSEQQTVDCDTSDSGCSGGFPYTAYQYMISAGGVEGESDYPYTGEDGTCQFNSQDIVCPISSWEYVTQDSDEDTMQQFCYSNSPLSVCVDASSWQTYTGGVLTPNDCTTNIDHCVQLTGWQTVSGTPAWTIRNSWGTDWGVSGYIYLERGGDTCAVADLVTVPCVTSKDGSSQVC